MTRFENSNNTEKVMGLRNDFYDPLLARARKNMRSMFREKTGKNKTSDKH